jgi:hypothetical protein
MKLKDYILILVLAGDAIFLHFANVDLTTIILLVLMVVIFRLFKTTIYTKIEKRVRSRVNIISTYPEWVVKLIIIIFFVISLILLKWIVFEVFKLFGFDIKQTLMESIKQFVKSAY